MQRHALVSLILSGLLLYGGLFPLQGWHTGNAIGFLTERHPVPSGMDDLLVNVLIFIPLGFAALLALNRRYRLGRSMLLAVLHGFCLSFAIEAFQAFLPLRYSSLTDLGMNTLGTVLGATAAAWYRTHSRQTTQAAVSGLTDARTRLVYIALAAWALGPLLPLNLVTDMEGLHERLHLLLRGPDPLHPWSLGTMLVSLLAVLALGSLGQAVAMPPARLYAAVLLPVLARVLVGDLGLRAEELAGGLLGIIVLWTASSRTRRAGATLALAALVAGFILTEALPGASAAYRTFNWVPFKAHLQNPVIGIEALLASIWVAAGLAASLALTTPEGRWRLALAATAALAITSFGLEVHQLRLPGRSPDITHPIVLALSALLAFASLGMLRARRTMA